MFASGAYGMPHGYPSHFPPYTTTPLNSPPLGMHGLWDYNTPAPTPQPQASPFSSSGRSSQRRRRSEQIPRDGVPSFPSTPQPNRNSATPGAYPPFYNTPSPRPAYAPVPSPAPGQGEFFYPMAPGGPVPPATPGFSPHAYPADFEPAHHAPSRDKTRSRNSRTRTPGSTGDMQSPGGPLDEIRRPTPPTKEEAAAAGIPQGYATKNWDPQERPIMLLGSVFDANSLGKWIYDWTVYRHSTQSSTTEMAGELWLLLIQLSGKSKRARECVENHRIKRRENETLVSEFLESGDRLWDRMKRLLKRCEDYMWVGAQAASGTAEAGARKGSPGVTMGKQSGKEFVDAMFSRDRELERTEKLMTGMRLWSMRFDANCEEILRRPHA